MAARGFPGRSAEGLPGLGLGPEALVDAPLERGDEVALARDGLAAVRALGDAELLGHGGLGLALDAAAGLRGPFRRRRARRGPPRRRRRARRRVVELLARGEGGEGLADAAARRAARLEVEHVRVARGLLREGHRRRPRVAARGEAVA